MKTIEAPSSNRKVVSTAELLNARTAVLSKEKEMTRRLPSAHPNAAERNPGASTPEFRA